jgi:uridine kinase
MEQPLCGVSIVRAGAPMERALREVVQDIPLGKLLIQTDTQHHGHQPQLHYCKLPKDIAGRVVLLADAQIATGAAGLMAIRVLLDHGVREVGWGECGVLLALYLLPHSPSSLASTTLIALPTRPCRNQ